jgi:hypothetical protein
MTIVSDAPRCNITYTHYSDDNYAHRVINYAPREYLHYGHHLQSPIMIVTILQNETLSITTQYKLHSATNIAIKPVMLCPPVIFINDQI